jgi:cytochrome c-type biogenesis protein CcmH/NrfG
MIFFICAAILCAVCVACLWQDLLRHHQVTLLSRRMAIILAFMIPILMVGLYMAKGSVGMPDFPAKAVLSQADIDMEKRLLEERPLIRALRSDPQNEALWVELITLYVETNRLDQAQQAYQDGLQSVPRPKMLKKIPSNIFHKIK